MGGADVSEHHEQSLVFQWATLMADQYPELRWLYAVPNGGHRHIAVARRMKREGVKRGVPDICLPCARGGYNALYVEMKRLIPRETKTKGVVFDKPKPSAEQNEWRSGLAILGNCVVLAYGAEAAQRAIMDYLQSKYLKLSA